MKLVWCPDTASKAYIDTVKSCELFEESSVAELVSAMAAGWKAKVIVEAWSVGGVVSTSIGLAVASRHTGARHVCVVQDERSRLEYVEAMLRGVGVSPEVIVGEAKEVMMGISEVDFLVVDLRRKDFARVLRVARFSNQGAVVVCKHANAVGTSFRLRGVLPLTTRVVRTVCLPVGKGLDIVHVGSSSSGGDGDGGGGGGGTGSVTKGTGRWIRHVDEESGEEHLFRK
ncbi:uncharacterized protein LOC122062141 [Macadamia integrifolia]|uniref:uncharacterized protein LOC122062141 n=1 Tax=Macadamia integrifolia TaxID=60698 RepID=UPI001C52A516|nr:uncharacterized protein LOC122062141 [Macadamia integrifolia]XP_042481747.1 uncharacterized protein LOC122062141 [Macadamia integrifolia]